MTWIKGGVCAAKGFVAAGVHCGIRKNRGKADLALIMADKPCRATAVYTQNKVKAAPIIVTSKHLEDGMAQAIICNSGNANAATADGEAKAIKMCQITAKATGIKPIDIIVASTGVIGQSLPIEPIEFGMDQLVKKLSVNGSDMANEAIMTTDTCLKEAAIEFKIGQKTCHIGAIAKGSGMIHPNMGTMLCFITTDAYISNEALSKALKAATIDTFNMISVDGDTSTNDMVALMASGYAENAEINFGTSDYDEFLKVLTALSRHIAREIAWDGEGSSKLITSKVTRAFDDESARMLAKSVITSSLVKAAMFGSDANWGRVICALGYSGGKANLDKVAISFASSEGRIVVCQEGKGVDFSEEKAKKILSQREIEIEVTLSDGPASAIAYGCDLTYEYVRINGDYRS